MRTEGQWILLLLLTLCLSLSTTACGNGDDDGSRLADLIAGTWLRGWEPGDVVIEGNDSFAPDDFDYSSFVFQADGTYNGMVRTGSFTAYGGPFGDDVLISDGSYKCDNSNLRLEYTSALGGRQTILAQVVTFSDRLLRLRYENDTYNVSVTMTLYRPAE